MMAINHFRTIWISDVHLGTKGCKAEYLLDFFRHNESDHLYLVGDIIDGWSLRRGWYWPQSHNDVLQKVLRKARKGTVVTFVPGNHDEFARAYVDHLFGGIRIKSEAVHITAKGKRLLILHGDEFDSVVTCAKWLAVLGSHSYECALVLNRWLNHLRMKFGYPYWSLSAYLKQKVKNAVKFIENYENAVSAKAQSRGVDGVVCGHIHKAEIRDINGLLYCNDGDWVESCTALVETFEGELKLVQWGFLLSDLGAGGNLLATELASVYQSQISKQRHTRTCSSSIASLEP